MLIVTPKLKLPSNVPSVVLEVKIPEFYQLVGMQQHTHSAMLFDAQA